MRRRLVLVLAVVAWLALSVLAALRTADDDLAYRLGVFLGTAVASLLVGTLLWLLVRLARRRTERAPGRGRVPAAPFAAAAVVALVVTLAAVGREAAEAAACEDVTAASPRTVLAGPLPAGVTLQEVPEEREAELFRGSPFSDPAGIDGEVALRGGAPVGAVFLVTSREGELDEEELLAGFAEGAGGATEEIPLAGDATGALARVQGGATAIGSVDACRAVVVSATDPGLTRALARLIRAE